MAAGRRAFAQLAPGLSALCIAHRGASGEAPENTLEAFELAIEQRADMIETDLHLTRDGRIVLAHDSQLASVEIGTLSLEQLQRRAPSVPTLEQALELCGARIPFNLELKSPRGRRYQGLERRVLEAVRGFDLLGRTLFSCFDDRVLKVLRELEPDARIALLIAPGTAADVEERARRLGAEAVNPGLVLATPGRIAELQAAGLDVPVYTVDLEADTRRLLEAGVDGLFTNYPGRLREQLERVAAADLRGARNS